MLLIGTCFQDILCLKNICIWVIRAVAVYYDCGSNFCSAVVPLCCSLGGVGRIVRVIVTAIGCGAWLLLFLGRIPWTVRLLVLLGPFPWAGSPGAAPLDRLPWADSPGSVPLGLFPWEGESWGFFRCSVRTGRKGRPERVMGPFRSIPMGRLWAGSPGLFLLCC